MICRDLGRSSPVTGGVKPKSDAGGQGSPTSGLLPLHWSPLSATLVSLLFLTSQIHSCLKTLAPDVPSPCGMIFCQNSQFSAHVLISHEASAGHLYFPSGFYLSSQLYFPLSTNNLPVLIQDIRVCISSLPYHSSM